MVKICNGGYPLDQETKYKEYFDKYPYRLSNFQKFALEAIVEGDHVLVTAHTGSGKTLPAEFAIEYFVGKGKKVIYTAPIKALSNQKFYEFGKKYKNISFGILTGDIKSNPEADVLIMTTEILLNTLFFNPEEHIYMLFPLLKMPHANEISGLTYNGLSYTS
jgi:superfamily II RNA helicase